MSQKIVYHKNQACVSVWDDKIQEWVMIYSLSTEISKRIPYEELDKIKKHLSDHSRETKGTGNER